MPLNQLIDYVETSHILYLTSCLAITADLNLNRLLEVASEVRGVGIIGMSERGLDGGWDYTCIDLKHQNSRLVLTEGYEYSRGSCIFCDMTSKSFLAVTEIVKKVLPDSSLPETARHIDWALRLRLAGILTMLCPEVMIHTTDSKIPVKDVAKLDKRCSCSTKKDKIKKREESLIVKRLYRKLAQKWQLTTIKLANKTVLEYSCLEIHFDCKAKTHVSQYMLPPCCLKIKQKMIGAFNVFAKDYLIPYEIKAGTLLGAIKFKNSLPWDFTENCYFPNSFSRIILDNKRKLQALGMPLNSILRHNDKDGIVHEYFSVRGQGGFSFDLYGVDVLPSEASKEQLKQLPGNLVCLQYGHHPVRIDSFLYGKDNITNIIQHHRNETIKNSPKFQDVVLHNTQTQVLLPAVTYPQLPKKICFLQSFVRIGDMWVVAGWNPALEAKEYFGKNLFKHRAHWKFEKLNSSWPYCSCPGHPLCLDIHPRDGNIPFF